MLSEKELRSLIWIQYEEGQEQDEEAGEHILDLSHQELRRLKQFELGKFQVQRLDASYNFFKDFGNLNFKQINEQTQLSVTWLDISFNFINQIDRSASACHMLKYLRYLNVSANQLNTVDFKELDVPFLQTLNVSNNKIKYFIHCPDSLKVLNISDNELTSLAFTGGAQLNILIAKKNFIRSVGLDLATLFVFDIQENRVQDVQMLKEFLGHSKELLSINLRFNPICKSKVYKVAVLQNCHQIGQIDEIIINPAIREGFKVIKAEEELDQMLDRVNKKYQEKLVQQKKIKDELIKKIRLQEKKIEEQYYRGIQDQKEQFQSLEKEANKILAKSKLAIVNQKQSFLEKLGAYGEQPPSDEVFQKEKESVQRQHYIEYLDYMNKRRPYSNQRPKARIRKVTAKALVSVPEIQSEEEAVQIEEIDDDGLVLFDPRALVPLLQNYTVEELEF